MTETLLAETILVETILTERTLDVTSLVVALKTITLLLGGLITAFAYKASRRTGSPALRALAVGFAVVTLGAFLAGVADQIVGVDRTIVLVIESALTAIGFGVITYSLYA